MKRKLIRRNKQFWTEVLHFVNDSGINFEIICAARKYKFYKNNRTTTLNRDDHTLYDWDNYKAIQNAVFVPIISSNGGQRYLRLFFINDQLPPELKKRLSK